MPTIEPLLWFDDEAGTRRDFTSRFSRIRRSSRSYVTVRSGRPRTARSCWSIFDWASTHRALNAGANGIASSTGALPRGAIALFVTCETQAELDVLWDALADGGEPLQCGWLRDRFGCSWNIVPAGLEDVLGNSDPAKRERAMKAMLHMVKLDLDALRRAADARDGA